MKSNLFLAACTALMLAGCSTVSNPTPDSHRIIADAVAAPGGRTAEARALDDSRRPVEVLELLGVRPGMDVADLVTESGYWAEILAEIVGPSGSVTAYQPYDFYDDEQGQAVWRGNLERQPAIVLAKYPFDRFAPPPNSIDAAIINISYHDKYWVSEKYKVPLTDPRAYVRALYSAVRPGGVVAVIDHVANPGTPTREVVDKLHRIDPEVVKDDYLAAGFTLQTESDLLRNPLDDHTLNVFDPKIRYKTDRFYFVFRKPG